MKLSGKSIQRFQNFIFSWWAYHKRDLPWRHTRDPHKILVSEMMLQQTQVARVLPKYDEFLFFFPDVFALAAASRAKVLRVWKGMGYNRRALFLRRAAEQIVKDYHGEFPESEKELIKLPGVGTYTARALLVFAYGEDVALVDTNIRQIITHFFFKDKLQKESVIQDTANQLLPAGKSWEWHQALMDYGALALERVSQKKSIPFKNSNRFYRGRIMDLLREKNYQEPRLLVHLTEIYNKPQYFFKKILSGLARDGLLARNHGRVSLPD